MFCSHSVDNFEVDYEFISVELHTSNFLVDFQVDLVGQTTI